MRKLTQSEFTDKASKVHNSFYTYDLSMYVNNKTKIDIICPKHGVFSQLPLNHLKGATCPTCNNEKRPTFKTSNTEEFTQKASLTHDNKYTYENCSYVNNKTKVLITCKTHGDFLQTPSDHLSGYGCPNCSKSKKLSMEDISERLFTLHRDTLTFHGYNSHTSTKTKISVECPTHGQFEKRLEDLLTGQGCPNCATSGYDKTKPGILYLLHFHDSDLFKIGVTNRSVNDRFNLTEKQQFNVLLEINDLNGGILFDLEQSLLHKYKEFRYTGPNLLSSGNTEILQLQLQHKESLLWDLNLFLLE